MELSLEQLYDRFGTYDTEKHCPVENQCINTHRGNFKKMLTREKYRQLQRILDGAEDITGKMSVLNFEDGLRYGIKFMAEIYAGKQKD